MWAERKGGSEGEMRGWIEKGVVEREREIERISKCRRQRADRQNRVHSGVGPGEKTKAAGTLQGGVCSSYCLTGRQKRCSLTARQQEPGVMAKGCSCSVCCAELQALNCSRSVR